MSSFLWIILVGFFAGIIARILSPGANNPSGFILTTLLGIAGAFLATCHSGVTLAANHAFDIAPQIAAGRLDDALLPFSARRFHVPQAA